MRSLMCIVVLILVALSAKAQCNQPEDIPGSPIVINFGNGDYRLTGADSPVPFDIDATGTSRYIGWTAVGTDQAFLWLDRNANSKVDSGAELFGTATKLWNNTTAGNGFVALAELDANYDAIIDTHDAAWLQLQLWRDLDHDGISQPNEIALVAGSGISAIELNSHWAGRRDKFGNLFKFESKVWIQKSNGQSTPHRLYDIFFVAVN